MFNQLPQFIESNSESLNAIIPAHLLAKLKIANDYHQIIKILLTPVHLSLTSLRLIDVLLKNDALHFLQLLKLLTKMPTQFWYQLLTTPSNQGVTPLEYWHLDKNGINEPLLTIITHIPANYDKLKLLTTSFKTDFYFSLGTYCTLLTSTLLSLTQRLRLLEGFNEADKFAGALTTEMPTQRSNLFMQLDNANHANNFIQSFTNLKWQQQLTHYLELAHLRQQATHFLGIADHPLTLDLEPHMLAHFEGMQPQNAINRFNEVLDKFEPMPAAMLPFKQEFSAIKQAFKAMDLTQDAEYFMQQYQQHNLVILDSGWADHSIALAATPDFLVVANRGQHQHFAGGCVIYPLVHPLNLAQIEQLTGYLTQYTFQKNLRQIINHDNNGVAQLFYALELSPQKYGTCTIANKKALVAGLLPLLKQLSTPNQKKEEILALSRTAYKAFTLHTRHIVLAKLINQVKLQQEIEQPITDFLNQHTNLAKPSELALLKQTSNNLPATVLTRLDKNLNPQAKFIMAYLQQFPNLTKVSDTVLQVISYSSILSNFEKQEIFLNHCLTLMHDDTKIINTSTWYRNQDILDFLLLTQQYFWLLNSLQNVSKDILKKSEVHLNIFIKITQAAQQSDQHNIPLIKLCINYIIDQLDQNQINALLTFNQLDHITEGYWLAYILENLTATQVIHFFNQIPKNQSPLSELRDLAYLKYVANNVSPQRFIEFMTISATNGNIYPLLFDYSNDIACFNFLKAQLNSKTLKQHINYYKKINITENPSKVTAQLNLLDAAKELTVFWAAQPQSKFIDTITKLSNTPQSTELAETLWGG
jgi:hypothetical protein